MSYSTFLIDLDHTLFDTEASEVASFTDTMLAAGIPDAEPLLAPFQRINLELWALVEDGEMRPQEVRTRRFERLVAEHDVDADPQRLADDYVTGLGTHGELFGGAYEMLDELSRRASLALVTNGLSEVQRVRIGRLGLDAYFDAIIISAEVGAAKPGTEIFDIAFNALKSPPRETAVMVGDNLTSDIQGGINYRIATCWYNPQRRAAHCDVSVDHEIADLGELLALIAP